MNIFQIYLNIYDGIADEAKKLHYFETCFFLSILCKSSLSTESSGSNEISREIINIKIKHLGLDNDNDAHSQFIPNLFKFYQQSVPVMSKQNVALLEDTEFKLLHLFTTKKFGSSWMLFYHNMSSLNHWSTDKIISKCFRNDANLSTFIDVEIKHGYLVKTKDKKPNMDTLYRFIQNFLPYLSQNSSVYPASFAAVMDLLQIIDLFHDTNNTHELFLSCLNDDNILETFISKVELEAK